jgi:hypothetical protein
MPSVGIRSLPALLCALLLGVPVARAELLVYEGFNGYGTGNLIGKQINANTMGLDTATNWATTQPGALTLQATSLTFDPSFITSGGSVTFGTTTTVGAAKLSLTGDYAGTLWMSYLVNLTARGGNASDGIALRVTNDNASGGDRFDLMADTRNSSTNAGVGYDGGTANSTNSGVNLTLGTTYLLIGSFTNVGVGLTVGNPGVGTMYALTAAQFASFQAAGGTESYLTTTAIGTGAGQVTARISDAAVTTGTFNFRSTDFASMVAVNGTGTFDELRYGTTLNDVTTIPEPGTATLLAIAGLGTLATRRRRNGRK